MQALERGIEPELVSERIAELRGEKEALEDALASLGVEREEAEEQEISEQLDRLPNLAKSLRAATPEIQRLTFEPSSFRSSMTRPRDGWESRRRCRKLLPTPSKTRRPSGRTVEARRTNVEQFWFQVAVTTT